MISVIGLGSAGCNIAEKFESISDASVYLIDKDIEGDNCYALKECNTPEEYERSVPNLSVFFKDLSKDVIFIVGGSGKTSGATLAILKQIKHCNITVLYIKDGNKNKGTEYLQQKVTFNVLQQYARSGLFKEIILIANEEVESVLGDIPIMGYHEALNNIIFSAVVSIDKFSKTEPILENHSEPKEVYRIVTHGLYDLNTNTERLFFPLDFADQKCYYFGVSAEDLKTNTKLLRDIKEKMNNSLTDCINYYKIFKTEQNKNFCYVKAYSKKVQI